MVEKLSHSSVVNIVGDRGIANLESDTVISKLQVTDVFWVILTSLFLLGISVPDIPCSFLVSA